jgi:hypothetical protein
MLRHTDATLLCKTAAHRLRLLPSGCLHHTANYLVIAWSIISSGSAVLKNMLSVFSTLYQNCKKSRAAAKIQLLDGNAERTRQAGSICLHHFDDKSKHLK